MDILICKMVYPNDPTKVLKPHQHFVGYFTKEKITLYSISSIPGKEFKVYLNNGEENPDYYLIVGDKQKSCGLKVPSFIDCTKAYNLNISNKIFIERLTNRTIPENIRKEILKKIESIKNSGNHTEYSVSLTEFIRYNPKLK